MSRRAALAFVLMIAAAPFGVGGARARSAEPAGPDTAIIYTCANGETVRALYPDDRTALIDYRGHTHTLKAAMSADGVRYVGDRLQWWTKGMTHGTIAAVPPGQTYAEPGPECVAPDR
ncbi:MAG: MliC family protein [Caulobacteraceae bacterium]